MKRFRSLAGFSIGLIAAGIPSVAGAATDDAAPVGTAPVDPASVDSNQSFDLELRPHCATRMLTPSELDEGKMSSILCFSTRQLATRSLDGHVADSVRRADTSGLVAIHYDSSGGSGTSLSIAGTDCNGGGINLDAADPWNDLISSTRHQLCSKIKHFETYNAGPGASQLTENGSGWSANLNSSVSNKVSAIRYYGPVN